VRVEVSLRAVLCPKRGSLLEGHLGAGGFAVLRQEAPHSCTVRQYGYGYGYGYGYEYGNFLRAVRCA